MDPVCQYCGREAELMDSALIYPGKPQFYGNKLWVCKPCQAWVTCHPGTSVPMGHLANKALRVSRQMAHEVFDAYWKSGGISRSRAYSLLARALGIDRSVCHIGRFNEEACYMVVEVCRRGLK